MYMIENNQMKSKLLEFRRYWYRSFDDPLDWFGPEAVSRDSHLQRKYGNFHEMLSEMKTNDFYEFLSTNGNNKRFFISILILLDQVSRQLHRNDCNAFINDAKARRIARYMCKHFDMTNPEEITLTEFCFWMMVFEHSENMKDHEFIREILELRIIRTEEKKDVKVLKERMLYYLDEHTKVLKEFGYYPKRKIVCGVRLNKKEKEYIERRNKNLPF
jgi:uncharacterized protein (DUF924 family)